MTVLRRLVARFAQWLLRWAEAPPRFERSPLDGRLDGPYRSNVPFTGKLQCPCGYVTIATGSPGIVLDDLRAHQVASHPHAAKRGERQAHPIPVTSAQGPCARCGRGESHHWTDASDCQTFVPITR